MELCCSMILVSACLADIKCNYKGESKPNQKIIQLIREGKAMPLCPEQLGGLTTPRSGARITTSKGSDVLDGKAKVLTDKGDDVTLNYVRGAAEFLEFAKRLNVKTVILKQGSPSCGNNLTQGGEALRTTNKGKGVTVALLEKQGINVYSEEVVDDEKNWRRIISEL